MTQASSDELSKNEEIERLRAELSGLKRELKDRNEAEAASMRELAESMKQTIDTIKESRPHPSSPAPAEMPPPPQKTEDDAAIRDIAEAIRQSAG